MMWRGERKPHAVIARSPCDEAIQFFLVAPGLLRFARNDGERMAETSPRHCEEPLRRSNPVLSCGFLDCFARNDGERMAKPRAVIAWIARSQRALPRRSRRPSR